jgi:hypothetical protein
MLQHAVTISADIDQVAVVEHAIDQRRCHHIVAQDFTQFLEAAAPCSSKQ